MSARRSRTILVAVLLGVAACSADEVETDAPERTERERDELIGQSALPGAQGVRGALRVQDSASARSARLDSIANAN